MNDLVQHRLASGNGREQVELRLRQMVQPKATPVLLLHGASAQSESFLIPRPDPSCHTRALADRLHAEGFEPWLLDWRGSCVVVDLQRATLERHPDIFDFDHTAQFDIPE